MKYDGELYNISRSFSKRVFSENGSFEENVLNFLKKKINNGDYLDLDGVLNITFKQNDDNEFDEGFYEIIGEVYNSKFISKAREYCIYLADIKPFADELEGAYINLLWDYQTYFESRSMATLSALDEIKKMKKM